MTSQQELIDAILADHPGKNETQARSVLNNAIAVFADETRIYRDLYTITTDGRTAYNLGGRVLQIDKVVIDSGVSDAPLVVPRLADPVQLARSTQAWQGGSVTGSPIVWYAGPSAGGTASTLDTQGYPDFHIGTIGNGTLDALTSGVAVKLVRVTIPLRLTDADYTYDVYGRIIKDSDGDAVAAVSGTERDIVNIPAPFRNAVLYLAHMDLYQSRTDLAMPERIALSRRYEKMYGQQRKQARAYVERMQSPSIEPRPHYY